MNQAIQLHQGTDLKLRDFEASDLVKITTTLIGLSSLMGLRELSGLEAVAISDFITGEFKDFTLEEVQNAFKMNASGRLLDAKQEKVKPYGSLNIDYVGTVLALYRTYRTNELRKVNKAAPVPEKTQEQKDNELKQVMNEVFNEMNDLFKKKEFKFSVHDGVKYYGCLKYYKLMPAYYDKSLWAKAIEQEKLKYVNSFDANSRKATAFLIDSKASTSDEVKERVTISVKNRYRSLLASKCVEQFKDMCDDLNEVKE